MQPKPSSWIFPSAILGVLFLLFPPAGHPGTYGRISGTKYIFLFDDQGSTVIDYTRLGIQIALVAAIAYSIAYHRANRPTEPRKKKIQITTSMIVYIVFGLLIGSLGIYAVLDSSKKPNRSVESEVDKNVPMGGDTYSASNRSDAPYENEYSNNARSQESSNDMEAEKEFKNPE